MHTLSHHLTSYHPLPYQTHAKVLITFQSHSLHGRQHQAPPPRQSRGGAQVIAGDAGASERLIKRVKGLLNRLAEANVQPSVEEAAGLLESEGRRPAMSALTQELLQVYCAHV